MSLNSNNDISTALNKIDDLVNEASISSGRSVGSVTKIAISKNHSVTRVQMALDAGHRVFGENRLQEALDKWPPLKEKFNDIELHFVGSLQGNKVARAVKTFNYIHTIDRLDIARKVAKEMEKSACRPHCFIQVNTGEESQKSGVLPKETDSLITECRDNLDLPLIGLMCVPPREEESALHFAFLREIAKRNGLKNLSMGMSADFETAIRFGATHIRIGTVVFGNRPIEEAL